jgi:hypothetical protein
MIFLRRSRSGLVGELELEVGERLSVASTRIPSYWSIIQVATVVNGSKCELYEQKTTIIRTHIQSIISTPSILTIELKCSRSAAGQ